MGSGYRRPPWAPLFVSLRRHDLVLLVRALCDSMPCVHVFCCMGSFFMVQVRMRGLLLFCLATVAVGYHNSPSPHSLLPTRRPQPPSSTGASVVSKSRPSTWPSVVASKSVGLLPFFLAVSSGWWMPPEPSSAAQQVASTAVVASAFDAVCVGFGCGAYNGVDFDGQVANPTGEPTITFRDFLSALDAKKVQKVELTGPNGDRAYASLIRETGGESGPVVERLLIGEGFPIEASKAWSSPLWVVRILKDRNVPVTTSFDFSGVRTKSSVPPPFKP